MEESIYFGEYVFISHLTQHGEEMFGGKLEKMSLGEDNSYKILFKELYVAKEGNYQLLEKNSPILKNVPVEYYLGITPTTKKELNKFYSIVNKKIKESKLKEDKPKTPTVEDSSRIKRYRELGNTGENFYSHGTKIGFLKDD